MKLRLFLAATVTLMALGGCNADKKPGADAPAAQGAIAATVNGTAIPASRINAIASQGAESGRPDTPETRKNILDGLTLQVLVAGEAVKKGLDKSPEVADQLEAVGQTVLANAYVQDFIKTHPVTDEMLKAEYERIKATITGTEYKARHILVDKEADARDIIAKLNKDPASFASLALAKSNDTGSKARGGDLGWFDTSRMVPEFGAAVAAMEKGKLTQDPVKTQFGYHVILLEDSRPIQAPPFEEVKPELSQQLQQQNVKKHLDDLKSKAKIEIAAAPAAAASAAP
jgi:peptidyl-prolyl cis-trans isomerase C